MPKLPRNWNRGAANILDTRDFNLFVILSITPGQTVERIHLSYRIMGRDNESTILDRFDAYYVGVRVLPQTASLDPQAAWTERDSDDWLWWEGAHYIPVHGASTPGQTHLRYPADGSLRDIKAKRLIPPGDDHAVIFSFAQSGGSVMTDCRVNVSMSVLILG